LLDNGSVKIPLAARQRIGRNVTVVTNTHATIKELKDLRFYFFDPEDGGDMFLRNFG
jgi:hypothetical protein